MSFSLPEAGSIDAALAAEVHAWWLAAVQGAGRETAGFDATASLADRIAWALRHGFEIGTIYTRFSSKRQHSTADQARTCVEHAARNRIYCPPELVSVDEAQRGYLTRRDGLNRMLMILKQRFAKVLLVFKASRLYRQAFKGYQLIQQKVVEQGLRAISVTQGIDTADTKAWKMLIQLHGMVDEMLVEATADHVRAGLKGLFQHGYTVGALPVGYRRKELPDAPLTNRGLPRTIPEIDPEVAKMIVEHYDLVLGGLPIWQGWKKWVADGGPTDPRSSKGYLSYVAYRRMLSRVAYTGRFEFGRKRNEFSTEKDYTRQLDQPEGDVAVFLCDELCIVSDEKFLAMQRHLAGLAKGPRGPRQHKACQLWDLVVDLFWCPCCEARCYQGGAAGKMLRCKNGAVCPHPFNVNRREAVRAVCEKLQELLLRDAALIEQVVGRAQEFDAAGDEQLRTAIAVLDRKLATLAARINDLFAVAGQGEEADRQEAVSHLRAAQTERAAARHERSRLQQRLTQTTATITPEAVRQILAEFDQLLIDAAAGQLGGDAVHRAVAVFRRLVGGRITVHVEQRPQRRRTNIRGLFRPCLIAGVRDAADQTAPTEEPAAEVTVWLRQPPRLDAIAERVHQLIDIERLGHRAAAKQLQLEGHAVNSGNVWYSYRRWYEMQGLPAPTLPYNNGRRRKSA